MFIQLGDRRINLSLVKQYKPKKKDISTGVSYLVELTYQDGSKEEIYFFKDEDKRNDFLVELDKNLLPFAS